jgi:UDP-N-acetyl-D-mannosaminuronic acid dehydrogenase
MHIAHNPERVLPGQVLEELVSNDRIVGGMSKTCSAKAIELYKTFVRGVIPPIAVTQRWQN